MSYLAQKVNSPIKIRIVHTDTGGTQISLCPTFTTLEHADLTFVFC